jgi:hypothetical protein
MMSANDRWLPFTIQDRLVYIYVYGTSNPNAAAWPAP